MPEIHPFQGLHYDPAKVGELSKVMTQPYDKIDDALRQRYYDRHPNSFIRIDKRKDEAGDAGGLAKYAAAAGELKRWQREGVLVRDPEPSLYIYHQVYRLPGGAKKTRKGFSAMVTLEEPGKGGIHPHEETHSGPKIDRRRLLDATETHLSQVFLVYSDPKKAVDRLLDAETKGKPDLEATDDFGDVHRVWRVHDAALIRKVQATLAKKDAIIADGHHRYETAWGYAKDHPASDKVLATLVNMDDEGMTIFGTHRVIRDLAAFNAAALLDRLRGDFELKSYPAAALKTLLADLKWKGSKRPSFGFVAAGDTKLHLLTVKNLKRSAARVKAKHSLAWRSLDNNLLHVVILEGMLGITPEHTAREEYVDYVRSAQDAVAKVRKGGLVNAAFLVNPVTLDQIRTIVKSGERFPQKSTDFFPKLLSGLVMCPLS